MRLLYQARNTRAESKPKKEPGLCEPFMLSACNDTLGQVRLCEHEVVSWVALRSFLTSRSAGTLLNSELDFEFEMDIKTCH